MHRRTTQAQTYAHTDNLPSSRVPVGAKNYHMDSNNNNLGESIMIKEKVFNNLPKPMPYTYY